METLPGGVRLSWLGPCSRDQKVGDLNPWVSDFTVGFLSSLTANCSRDWLILPFQVYMTLEQSISQICTYLPNTLYILLHITPVFHLPCLRGCYPSFVAPLCTMTIEN